MQDQIFIAALTGLLYDTGKLIQRSRQESWKKPEAYQGKGIPVHVAWSADFIWQHVPEKWRGEIFAALSDQTEASPAANTALSDLVSLADMLSAGERSDIEQDQNKQFPMQLQSIFDRIALEKQEKARPPHFLPLAGLALGEESIFPVDIWEEKKQRDAYVQLVETLVQEAEFAKTRLVDSPVAYLEHMLSALQRTTWCVPSAYYDSLPDVSFYDHSRMTAALAVCLSELEDTQISEILDVVRRDFSGKAVKEDAKKLSSSAALLVGGDISGIQDFIYTISSKDAAKSLRGRSFYLQVLTETVLRFVLRGLELPYTNVIYSGGGHFYLLAPLSVAGKLKDLQTEVTNKLLKHHGTSLYLAIGSAEVSYEGFKKGHFPEYWGKMHQKLKLAKQQRYTELGSDLYNKLFVPVKHGGNQEKLCSVCGQEREDVHAVKEEEGEERYRICSLCESFADPLGKFLPLSNYLLLGLGAPQERQPGTSLDVLAEFGVTLAFMKDEKDTLKWLLDGFEPEQAIAWAFNDVKSWPRLSGLPLVKQQRYTVNRIPAMTFDKLQECAEGIPRLGVLRMDVDNLGMIFQKGFGKTQKESVATLARISTLSFQMSLFFEGWVKRITENIKDQENEKPLIYSVYAGGDDVFLIGPWDKMPYLAREIVMDFKKYTGENPDVHLSGGMTFIHGKYPVYQAAEDAGHALDDLAKGYPGKDAFAFLGHAWKWHEFNGVMDKKNRLVRIMNMKEAPKSLLQLLQRLAEQEVKKRLKHNKKRVWGPWMWIGDYQFTRMAERASGELKEALQTVLKELQGNLYADIFDWGKAARWTELFVRKDKN